MITLKQNINRLKAYVNDFLEFAGSHGADVEKGRFYLGWMVEIIARYDLEVGRLTSEEELLQCFQQCIRKKVVEPAAMVSLLEEVKA